MLMSIRLFLACALFFAAPVMAQDDNPEESGQEAPPPATPAQPAPAPPPPAADDPGRALFQKAADALAKAQSIAYRAKTSYTGDLFVRTGRIVEADIRQVRQPGGILPGWRVRIIGTSSGAGGQPPHQEFDIGWMLVNVEWVDHEQKKVFEKPYQETRRVRNVIVSNPVRLEEMTAYRPFQKELAAASYTMEAQEEVRGTLCDVVLITMNQGRIRSRWWFSTTDHLPRKQERPLETRSGTSSSIVEFYDFRIDTNPPSLAMLAGLRVRVPEGYAEDRPPTPTPSGNGTPSGTAIGTAEPTKEPAMETSVINPAPIPAGPPMAPAFDLLTPSGEHVTLESLRGRVVLLEFSGSWCVNLHHARPELAPVLDRFKSRPFKAYALSVREKSKDAAVAGHAGSPESLGLLLNAESTARNFGATALPAYTVIGPTGDILLAPTPFTPETTMRAVAEAIESALSSLPAEPSSP